MMEIIPAIDLIEGRCVRLSQGDFSRATSYSGDPVETAKRFEDAGIRRLHIVDLEGARSGAITSLKTLEAIASGTRLEIDFGGGISTDEEMRSIFDAGASIANVGSVAARSPERFFGWIESYGADRILLGADVKSGSIAIDAWQTVTSIDIISYLREYFAAGIRQAFVTDVARDGVLEGPAIELYEKLRVELPDLRLIASGGVRVWKDIDTLECIGCAGVIVGRAIYEGRITLPEISTYAR